MPMTWIEQRLNELAAEGFFDDLPGNGEPIADLDTQYEPTWWAQRWIQRDAARQAAEAANAPMPTREGWASDRIGSPGERELQELIAREADLPDQEGSVS